MKNSIWLYRAYNVTDVFDLKRIEEFLSKNTPTGRFRFSKVKPKSIIIKEPPVCADLQEFTLTLDRDYKCSISVRIYQLGVICLILKIVIPVDFSYENIKELSIKLDSFEKIDQIFDEYIANIKKIFRDAGYDYHQQKEFEEDYTVYFFDSWSDNFEPVSLLLKEKDELSSQTRSAVLANSYSYSHNDLAIITWDSALIYDYNGSTDECDLLEFALTHLVQLRYYDWLLNQEMDEMYDDVKKAGAFSFFFRLDKYRKITRKLMKNVADVTDIMEKVRNSLKVTEDIFYAKVYTEALRIFYINNWHESVKHKIEAIKETYEMLTNEIEHQRSVFLEILVCVLIAAEIVIFLYKPH